MEPQERPDTGAELEVIAGTREAVLPSGPREWKLEAALALLERALARMDAQDDNVLHPRFGEPRSEPSEIGREE
jgi:hypothetical protein